MRIKDLATRATKLLTGNAWFVVDNGTKVEKAAYSEVVKQGIEEYAGSTLAGSAQSVKSALDTLNSKHKYFNSTETDRNVAIHNIVSSIISNYSNGDAILCTLNFSGSLYCGFMWKGSATIMFGRFYRPNANGGFYFRDSTTDSSATSTDFS